MFPTLDEEREERLVVEFTNPDRRADLNLVFHDPRPIGDQNRVKSIPELFPDVYHFSDDTLLPFRLRVQQALTLALRQIHPDNGFHYDLTHRLSVVRGRIIFSEEDTPDNAVNVVILEEPFSFDREFQPASARANTEPYGLIIQGFLPNAKEHPTDSAHVLVSDVKRRLAILKRDEELRGTRVFRFGSEENSVLSVDFDGGVVRPAEDATEFAHFWLRVGFNISEDFSAPGA